MATDLDQGIFANLADEIVEDAGDVTASDRGIHVVEAATDILNLFDEEDDDALSKKKASDTAATADDSDDGEEADEDIDWKSKATAAERQARDLERQLKAQQQSREAEQADLTAKQRQSIKAHWNNQEAALKRAYQAEYAQFQSEGATEREIALMNRFYRAGYDKIQAERKLSEFVSEVGQDFVDYSTAKDARVWLTAALANTNQAFAAVGAHKSLQLDVDDVLRNGKLPRNPDEAKELIKSAYKKRADALQRSRVKATAANGGHKMPTQGASGKESFDKVRAGYIRGTRTLDQLVEAGNRATKEQRALAGI